MKTSALDTPMMRQFLAVKARHPDSILFYRMGDFYEMFLDDAELAAPLLDIALTTRDKGKPDAVPMCGVPVHAADQHIKRLAELGHRIAICEQVEDPRAVGGKRLVKRDVVEVVTPGLVGDPSGLDALREVSVAAVLVEGQSAGLACLEASTGEFRAADIGSAIDALLEELRRIAPREVLISPATESLLAVPLAEVLPDASITLVADESFDPARAPVCPDGFDSSALDLATRASAAILAYLGVNQPASLAHAPRLRHYGLADTMVLDAATRTHLELFENGEDRGRKGTLLARLDASTTALGARRLARWVGYPLLDPSAIAARQDGVTWLAERDRVRARLREALREVRDLERILARAARPASVPRDLGVLRESAGALPRVCAALAGESTPGSRAQEVGQRVNLLPQGERPAVLRAPDPVPSIHTLLCDALIDDPPVIAKGSRGANETGYIREGFRTELDSLRESATKGREWIAGLEAQERERSGIGNLKVRYHPVHGYSFEVPKSQLAKVPVHYERKQTLANVERFTTDALREVESNVMGANERAAALEREILEGLRDQVVEAAHAIRAAADAVADLDAVASLAEVARQEAWVRPLVDSSERIEIRAGRHPVVEAMLGDRGADGFVPNDVDLDPGDTQILLLTGPNMSGKSTYLRQVALIVLMAQMGSFVPAESARIGCVDRIFTRVGASDRLARGESTFMVEMRETAEILRQASRNSLIILDEIGRGTSTFDGLSIAWAVAEYLHDTPGLSARTLFATHYHELTDLAHTKPRVRNAHFEVREWKDEVVFLRRLVPGGANRSYGIQVARLAGLPDTVIHRARQILKNLEGGEFDRAGFPRLARAEGGSRPPDSQLPLLLGGTPDSAASDASPGSRERESEILKALRALDVDRTAPMDALVALQRWKKLLDDEEEA